MPKVGTFDLVREASFQHVGIGAFNVIHLETAEALIDGAEQAKLPMILQLSHNCIRFHNDQLAPIGKALIELAERSTVPIAVHLDHCESVILAKQAIDLGFDSVMYDGSTLDFEENVLATRAVVDYAHRTGVSVEAELGEIGGKGAHCPGVKTDPEEAKLFVSNTGVDGLAVAVGNEHAMQERTAKLDLELISRLKASAGVPLILHGSSGVPDEEIQRGIAAGMTKINVSTHFNGYFTRALREYFDANPSVIDSRKYMSYARKAVAAEAKRLLEVFRNPLPASD
ncbi:MAG: class II fructose-bisphosphate aldolase [Corynebacterium sp.]|nr:class II fructose-bisphosphate aldolase [Corynebacterium sp.]